MRLTKILVVLFIFTAILFAQADKKNNNDYLAFAGGDNNIAIGILAGWGNGDGFGFPIVYDRGAFGGMFSFGGELRMWWAKYGGYWNGGRWYSDEYTKFGWSPMFRFMYHPFGMPALKGQVKIANIFDPYIGAKFGLSVINYDNDDPYYRYYNRNRRKVDFPCFSWITAGIRWYFKENIALWSEFSEYDFSLGINFKF